MAKKANMMKRICALILVFIFILLYVIKIHATDANTNTEEKAGSWVSNLFTDIEPGSIYEDDVGRLAVLGIIKGNGAGKFRPDDFLTREEFAILMVRVSGLEDEADLLMGSTSFPDIEAGRYSSGYINVAANKGYITAMPNGEFNPERPVTYAQILTVLVRALGYTDGDLQGTWPDNYIDKAKSLGLVKDVEFNASDYVKRWVAAVLINRLLETKISSRSSSSSGQTSSSQSQGAKIFGEAAGICSILDCIILGNRYTSSKLKENQLLTDNGIFYLDDNIYRGGRKTNIELGARYQLTIVEDRIVWISAKLNKTMAITVSSSLENQVEYYRSDKSRGNVILPEKTQYYYKGEKVKLENVQDILQQNSTVVFAYNKDMNGYEYAVVFDPVFSVPGIKTGSKSGGTTQERVIGPITIDSSSVPIIKNGEIITLKDIKEGDVVYEVTDIYGENKYILVLDQKVFGSISAIIPNIMAANALEIDGRTYSLGSSFDTSKISGGRGSFSLGDSVVALLGAKGEIVDILSPERVPVSNYAFILDYSAMHPVPGDLNSLIDNGWHDTIYNVELFLENGSKASYYTSDDVSEMKGKFIKYRMIDSKWISVELQQNVDNSVKKKFVSAQGFFTECIILGDSKTVDYLSENQILTDMGILYNLSGVENLELGNKYRVVIGGNSILAVEGKLKSLEKISVSAAIGTYIVSGEKNGETINMELPRNITYYYKGQKQSYDNIKNVLSSRSSIILAYNNDKTGYEYGVIFDPVYSKPEVWRSGSTISMNIGSINLNEAEVILKDSKIIDRSDIHHGDVIYEISDIWGGNKYILVVDKKVEGVIKAITPNVLSPQYIQINNQIYEIDKSMDISKISGKPGSKKVGYYVVALLGYDGKIIDFLDE